MEENENIIELYLRKKQCKLQASIQGSNTRTFEILPFRQVEKLAKMSKYVNNLFLYFTAFQQNLQYTEHWTISIFIITSPTIQINSMKLTYVWSYLILKMLHQNTLLPGGSSSFPCPVLWTLLSPLKSYCLTSLPFVNSPLHGYVFCLSSEILSLLWNSFHPSYAQWLTTGVRAFWFWNQTFLDLSPYFLTY